MWSLGDKIASSIVAQTAKVPTLPWSGDGLTVNWTVADAQAGKVLNIPEQIYKQGCVANPEEGLKVIILCAVMSECILLIVFVINRLVKYSIYVRVYSVGYNLMN